MKPFSREIFTSQPDGLTPDTRNSNDTQISEKHMREAISAAILTELSGGLSNDELGAAIRLIARICETKRPISIRTAHISAGMDKRSWSEVHESVLAFFEVTDAGIDLPEQADVTNQDDVQHINIKRQAELNLLVPSARRAQVPQYATAEKPPTVSIRKAIYEQALSLFKNAGMTENTARSVLANMLKNYSEGDVAMAVSDASRKDYLAEPHTWILATLKGQSRAKQQNARSYGSKPNSTHKLVTPELTGVSATKADKIRARNRNLTLKIED